MGMRQERVIGQPARLEWWQIALQCRVERQRAAVLQHEHAAATQTVLPCDTSTVGPPPIAVVRVTSPLRSSMRETLEEYSLPTTNDPPVIASASRDTEAAASVGNESRA
jgi:hypothetical protein